MPRYKCTVEYVGTDFAGWQKQHRTVTVQGILEYAIHAFCGQEVNIQTAGRTDAGVHALGQVFHADLEGDLDPEKIRGALNFHVRPHLISVLEVEQVSGDFHARFSAKKRYYQYHIINRRSQLALDTDRAWHVPVTLDIAAMKQAASYMLGQHDFTSFRDGQCQAKSPIKTLDQLDINVRGDRIIFDVSAKSFLHHMVRNLVGTLVHVGEGKWPADYIHTLFEAKDRTLSGPTAPACGLYFMKVDY